jgi:hypothetical protein
MKAFPKRAIALRLRRDKGRTVESANTEIAPYP